MWLIMDIRVLVGNRIKALRQQKNISQESLAALCELDRTYISGVKSGKRNISIINLEKIALSLGANIRVFFDVDYFEGR